ncbi:MAG: G8 domain-containing protein, partial [Fulvivirga sp.]
MKSLYLIFIFLLATINFSNGQQVVQVNLNDSVTLSVAETYRGELHWQSSFDQTSWESIENAQNPTYKGKVSQLPVYFRAQITEENCPPVYSETIEIIQIAQNLWSDVATWGDVGKPVAGQEVIIPEGVTIVLDENTPALGGLDIKGSLIFMDKDLELTSEWILVEGLLQVGSESSPFENKAVINLTDTDTEVSISNMGTRGIMVMGGTLRLIAKSTNTIWTKINDHAEKDSQNLILEENVDWLTGDEIVIAPTDYYTAGNGISISQKTSIVNIDGTNLTISDPLNAFRWGRLQYATTEGMSLTPDNLITPPQEDTETKVTPLVLDERAEIGHLTRNIVIQAPDDDVWNSIGFGVHIMIMGPESKAFIDGVEIKRGGQRNRLRRYPFHWHMLSYSGSQTLNDADGQYFKNSVVNSSKNRGIVIHGTNGVLVQNNIVYDVQGHGIFTEDAVERRNIIDHNLVLHIRNPPFGAALKQHESGERGASGFWISNPDNTITNNVAADCGTNGYWLAFTTRPWGESSSVLAEDGLLLNPSRLLFGIFDNNTAHSNGLEGIMLDRVEIDEEGNTFDHQYFPTTNGRDPFWPFTTSRR